MVREYFNITVYKFANYKHPSHSTVPPTGLLFIPQMIQYMSMESHDGMILTGEK
jgi:hypothetical protein